MINIEITNQEIHEVLANRREIAVIWCIEDVKEVRPDLTDDQCWDVLEAVRHDHDAGIGISWDVLSCVAELLFDDAPESASP